MVKNHCCKWIVPSSCYWEWEETLTQTWPSFQPCSVPGLWWVIPPERRGKRWGISSCWHADSPFVLFLKLTRQSSEVDVVAVPGRCIFPLVPLPSSEEAGRGEKETATCDSLLHHQGAIVVWLQSSQLNSSLWTWEQAPCFSSSPTLKIHAGEIRLWWRVLNSKDREPCCWRQKSLVGPWSLFLP